MKYLKLFELYREHDDGITQQFTEIGDNINDILYDIVDDGNPHLYPAMYNKKLHGVGGLMIEIASNPNNEIRKGEGNVWVKGYDYFVITEKIIDSLNRCVDYIYQINSNNEKKYKIDFNVYDGFLGKTILDTTTMDNFNLDKLLGEKPSFIGITIK